MCQSGYHSTTTTVVHAADYYPFGMVMHEREFNTAEYRYGFNGKEKDTEWDNGESGNIYDYGFRIYNPGLGQFYCQDPLLESYPWYSPYQFAGRSPIRNSDLDGLEEMDECVKISYSGNYWIYYPFITANNVCASAFNNTIIRPWNTCVYLYKSDDPCSTFVYGLDAELNQMSEGLRDLTKQTINDPGKTINQTADILSDSDFWEDCAAAWVTAKAFSIVAKPKSPIPSRPPSTPQIPAPYEDSPPPNLAPKQATSSAGKAAVAGGAYRAGLYGAGWPKGSLKTAIQKYAPGSTKSIFGEKEIWGTQIQAFRLSMIQRVIIFELRILILLVVVDILILMEIIRHI